jgi:hypothetical protein
MLIVAMCLVIGLLKPKKTNQSPQRTVICMMSMQIRGIMFQKGKRYKHESMRDVHFEVKLVEFSTEEGVKLFIDWHNHSMNHRIGPERILVKHKDIPYYSEFTPKPGVQVSEEELSGYGEDMS